MTFITGIRCFDGLVIAAEELEGDGVTKRYRQKLHPIQETTGWGMVWGGSGTAYVVDKFGEKLKELLERRKFDRAKIELEIEQCLQFVRKQYARPSDQIDVVIGLFGAEGKKETRFHLYKGSSGPACIAEQKEYCVAGMDCTLAVFLLDNCRNPSGCVSEAVSLAFLSTSFMNKYAEGCGGPIDCFTYRIGDDNWRPVLNSELEQLRKDFTVEDLEAAITDYWLRHPNRISGDEVTKAHLKARERSRS